MSDIQVNTAQFSLTAQLVLAILSTSVLYYKQSSHNPLLWQLLYLDTVVQYIELLFYICLFVFGQFAQDVAIYRYIDWFITTPIMLITMAAFFKHLKSQSDSQTKPYHSVRKLIQKERNPLFWIAFYNFVMLLFGLLGEAKIIPKYLAFIIGTLAFIKSFQLLYSNYVKNKSKNDEDKHTHKKTINLIFYITFFIWAIYGVAYLTNSTTKNSMYNLLDLVSKNIYGGVLAIYLIYQ